MSLATRELEPADEGVTSQADPDRSELVTPDADFRRGDTPTMTDPSPLPLRDAFARSFPAGPAWAVEALARLGRTPDDVDPVRAIVQGWMRLGGERDALLVDTLFVLTEDELGFGQTHIHTSDPNWIPLSTIVALDLIEGVPYPLEAIEVQFAGGLAIFVGWPEEFSRTVLDTLLGPAERRAWPRWSRRRRSTTPPSSTAVLARGHRSGPGRAGRPEPMDDARSAGPMVEPAGSTTVETAELEIDDVSRDRARSTRSTRVGIRRHPVRSDRHGRHRRHAARCSRRSGPRTTARPTSRRRSTTTATHRGRPGRPLSRSRRCRG